MSDEPHEPPRYSRHWLNRPFAVTNRSMAWGRYAVPSNDLPKYELVDSELEAFSQIFRALLQDCAPADVQHFDSEVQALRALVSEGGNATPRTFDGVLKAVFEAAKPFHGMHSGYFVEYAGPVASLYGAVVQDQTTNEKYLAWFSENFVLQSIESYKGKRVVWSWPAQHESGLSK